MMKTAVAVLLLFAAARAACAATPETAPIQKLDDALIAVSKAGSGGAAFQARYETLDPVVKTSLDLPAITQNSVGFLWSTLPAAQQQALRDVMEQFTVASYVHEFGGYSGQSFKMSDQEKTLGTRKIVETQIVPGDGGAATELDYVMTEGAAGWRASDVLLNGTVSQVAIHASDFSALVTSGDASQLIAALKAKVAALHDGTASN